MTILKRIMKKKNYETVSQPNCQTDGKFNKPCFTNLTNPIFRIRPLECKANVMQKFKELDISLLLLGQFKNAKQIKTINNLK